MQDILTTKSRSALHNKQAQGPWLMTMNLISIEISPCKRYYNRVKRGFLDCYFHTIQANTGDICVCILRKYIQ